MIESSHVTRLDVQTIMPFDDHLAYNPEAEVIAIETIIPEIVFIECSLG